LIELLNESIEDSFSNTIKQMVSKLEQSETMDKDYKKLDSLLVDIENLEKKEFAELKENIDKILNTVLLIKSDIDAEIIRIQGGVKLDINLEGFFNV
jgi:hypothetical protein